MTNRSPEGSSLGDLVGRTGGLQPWRRVFHMLSGLGLAGALTWLEPSRGFAVVALGAVFLILLAADIVRLASKETNRMFFATFLRLASPREAAGVASSTWYVLGVGLCVAFFPLPVAVSGVLVLALADPAASYIGRRWGEIRFLGGTVEGSLVFAAVAFAVLISRHSLLAAVAAAVLTTLAERLLWPLDDNVAVPVACAAALAGMETLF